MNEIRGGFLSSDTFLCREPVALHPAEIVTLVLRESFGVQIVGREVNVMFVSNFTKQWLSVL